MTTPAPDPCIPACGGGSGTPTTVTAGPGVDVTGDPTAGYVVSAPPSADAGNLISLGSDGNVMLDCGDVLGCGGGGTPTVVTGGIGTIVTPVPGGYNVTAPPSSAPGNLIATGPDGLALLTCAQIAATCGAGGGQTTVTAGPGVDVTGDPTAGYTVSAPPSTDPGNLLTLGTDGNMIMDCADVAGCVRVIGDPLTPEVTVTGGGTVANPYVVSHPPQITPRARVRTSADIPQDRRVLGGAVVPMSLVTYDRGGMFAGGAGSSALVVPAGWDGVYTMGSNTQFRGFTIQVQPSFRAALMRVNGTTIVAYDQRTAVDTEGDSTIINLSTDYELVGGDVVELYVQWDDIGATYDVPLAATPEFSAVMWLTFLHR